MRQSEKVEIFVEEDSDMEKLCLDTVDFRNALL